MILVVNTDHSNAHVLKPTRFADENIWERKHIEEWIRKNPQILGEELLVVSIEFDQFDQSGERIDVLAVDGNGNLVVVELKRSSGGGSAELQAIRYAAMVSTMTLSLLAPHYVSYLRKYDNYIISDEEAMQRIRAFVTNPGFEDLTDTPRIILCAQDFGPELTSTVLWLNSFGLDITCVRITPHRDENRLIIVPAVIIPVPEAKSYTVRVREKQERVREVRTDRKEKTFPFLLRNGIVKEGDILYLRNNLPKHMTFKEDDSTYQAEVTGNLKQTEALKWKKDGQLYSSSSLANKILDQFHPGGKVPGGVNGNIYWTNADGISLWDLDGLYRGKMATQDDISEQIEREEQ